MCLQRICSSKTTALAAPRSRRDCTQLSAIHRWYRPYLHYFIRCLIFYWISDLVQFFIIQINCKELLEEKNLWPCIRFTQVLWWIDPIRFDSIQRGIFHSFIHSLNNNWRTVLKHEIHSEYRIYCLISYISMFEILMNSRFMFYYKIYMPTRINHAKRIACIRLSIM